MIKKLLSIAAALTISSASQAQVSLVAEPAPALHKTAVVETKNSSQNAKLSTILVGDTLWYFFNKHFYRNPSGTGYFTVKSPYTSSTLNLTAFGCVFQNSGSITVSGLEAVLSRQASSPSASITVYIVLRGITGGVPAAMPMDSVSAVITGTAASFVGGNFATPKLVTGDYYVYYRKAAGATGDTIRAWMNNAYTATATAGTANQKYGEGLGMVELVQNPGPSAVGAHISMTGTFGAGSDYEFLVAPRVGFQATASQASSTVTPYCTSTPYSFNNTSSSWLTHRQYNLNEFYKRWKPFGNTTTLIAPDSVLVWNFGDGTGNMFAYNQVHTYAAAGTYNGTLTANYQKMADSGVKQADMHNFSKTAAVCAGINSLSGISNDIIVYPNPSSNGIVNINNLVNESGVEVFNMLGQSVYKDKTASANYTADLSSLPSGSYFLKITSANEKAKVVKLILN